MVPFVTKQAGTERLKYRYALGFGSAHTRSFILSHRHDHTLNSFQFHCSMTMTDTILFVKEARTCSYVLVIHTPRLCGEPGFRFPLDAREESIIRCREIVDSDTTAATMQQADPTVVPPEADQPYKLPRRKPVLAPPHREERTTADPVDQADDALKAVIQRALKAWFDQHVPDGETQPPRQQFTPEDEDVYLFDIAVDGDMEGADGAGNGHEVLVDALRAAGFEIRTEKGGSQNDEQNHPRQKKSAETEAEAEAETEEVDEYGQVRVEL
jgi:protein OS-9